MFRDLEGKLQLLGSEARFDSCGLPRNLETKWPEQFIYRAVGEGGFCINLFKVLQTNTCKNNCFYCANRKDRDFIRFSFSSQELAKLFFKYYQKRKIHGLFLSSAIEKDPNPTQEKMLETVRILRKNYNYQGYIHLKILPGVDKKLIFESAKLSDRISVNLETLQPYLEQISKEKDMQKLLLPTLENIVEVNRLYPLKAGVTTQLMVGVNKETDREIIFFADKIYNKYKIKRIYYSGFIPIEDTPLENHPECPGLREYRLYQADFLLRKYGFKKEEIVFDERGNLFLDIDPKLAWAKRHPEFFPVEINKASFEELLRVPGIGRRSAEKIVNFRRIRKIRDLAMLKKVIYFSKKSQNFITLDGKSFSSSSIPKSALEKQSFFWEEV